MIKFMKLKMEQLQKWFRSNHLTSLLLNVLLAVVAVILLRYLLPIAVIYTIILAMYNRSVKALSQLFRNFAISVDKLGNVICADLFNLTLIKEDKIPFGNHKQTVSYILGMNQGNLTLLGKMLVWVLDILDEDHVIKAVSKEN